MFGVGVSEMLIIAVVALIFVGPKRLPELMRQAGKFFVHARRMANDVKSQFDGVIQEVEEEIRREEREKMKKLLTESLQGNQQPLPSASDVQTPPADVGTGTHSDDPVAGEQAQGYNPSDTKDHWAAHDHDEPAKETEKTDKPSTT